MRMLAYLIDDDIPSCTRNPDCQVALQLLVSITSSATDLLLQCAGLTAGKLASYAQPPHQPLLAADTRGSQGSGAHATAPVVLAFTIALSAV